MSEWDDRADDYRELADKVIDLFNPPDSDDGELAIVFAALEQAEAFIARQPCHCGLDVVDPESDAEPCARCAALGQRMRQPEER